MKLQVFYSTAAIVFALGGAQAEDAVPARTQHAAAPASAFQDTAPATASAPAAAPASPATQPSVSPAARNQAQKLRVVRRPAPQQPEQRAYWSNFFRGYNQQGAPDSRYARPQQAGLQPAAPQGQSYYAARPAGNRLFLGMFYSRIPRETVAFRENHAPGTIIVRQSERRLYLVLGNGQALRYAVAVGREGAAWAGTSTVSNKR